MAAGGSARREVVGFEPTASPPLAPQLSFPCVEDVQASQVLWVLSLLTFG